MSLSFSDRKVQPQLLKDLTKKTRKILTLMRMILKVLSPPLPLYSHSSNQQLIILNHSVVSINPYQMTIPLHCLDCRRWGRHAWALSSWEVRFVLSLFQKALVINQFICFIIWMDIKFWLVILVETRMTIFPFIQLFFYSVMMKWEHWWSWKSAFPCFG